MRAWRRGWRTSLVRRDVAERAPNGGVSSQAQPLKVCIVGSGPGGFYAVEALQRMVEEANTKNSAPEIALEIDILERQAVPYGLVRFGVAPDHPEVKAVQHRYDAFMADPRLRFFGNVSIGSPSSSGAALSVSELLGAYDGVVLAVGAQRDRPLGVEGENLPGVYSAREFVAWYNGDPTMRDRVFGGLSTAREALVIGQGNVALDVARVLLHDPSQLAATDMPQYAVEALSQTRVEAVHIVGRRGPAQASFTNKEVREILNLPGVECHFLPPGVLSLNEASKAEAAKERGKKRMVDLFVSTQAKHQQQRVDDKTATSGDVADTNNSNKKNKKKQLFFHFLRSPVRFVAENASSPEGHVSGVELAHNELTGEAGHQKAVPTGEKELLPCGIVFKSIGYKSEPLEGVPFDQDRGVVPNEHGRVVQPDGSAVSGLYVSGWMKRGPSGVIGTNRMDAEETVAALWADLVQPAGSAQRGEKPGRQMIESKLRERSVPYVGWQHWKAIEGEEHRRGQALGKEREKITSVTELLDVAFKH